MVLAAVLAPFFLPILHIVTLFTLPATALYAFLGLVSSPVLIPILIVKHIVLLTIAAPLLLLTLPVSAPVGFLLASACTASTILKSFFVVFTPLLWPVAFFCKWWKYTFIVSKVVVTDTVAPWLVPIRFTTLTAFAGAKAFSP